MISFDHVTYTYEGKETPSLRDCTFSVKPGELILLTGESGCGKTTIIKLVNGLLQHTGGGTLAGTVMVGGQDVAQTPLWELARTVGSVFQNPKSQFFNLDTTSEVLFGLESRGASHDEMAQALESAVQVCGVGPLLERSIFALSGGEKQRIACASAWAMGPELFVLDEPSSNLDGEGIRQLREILFPQSFQQIRRQFSLHQSTVQSFLCLRSREADIYIQFALAVVPNSHINRTGAVAIG